MKLRLSRPSPCYSRTSLRKPSAIVLLVFLLAPAATYALTTDQYFRISGGRLQASIAVSEPPSERVIGSLRDGLESEVQYNVRVYERTAGVLGLLGDKLVGEYKETYRARWDEFSGDFILTADSRPTRRTISARAFLTELFSLSNVDTGIRIAAGTRYYVLSDVQIQIVRLVPPLTMIAPFLTKRQINTQWVKTEISAP